MKADAEKHAAEDKVRREVVDLKNRADATLTQARKDLEEHGGKVSPEVRQQVESAISAVETAMKGEEKDAIEKSMKTLEAARSKIGEEVYKAAGAAGAAGAAAPGAAAPGPDGATASAGAAASGKKDDVIDAEFEVKDEKKS